MKVSVCQTLYYQYEVDVPDDVVALGNKEIAGYADVEDPYFSDVWDAIDGYNGNYTVQLTSVVNDETGEVIWAS